MYKLTPESQYIFQPHFLTKQSRHPAHCHVNVLHLFVFEVVEQIGQGAAEEREEGCEAVWDRREALCKISTVQCLSSDIQMVRLGTPSLCFPAIPHCQPLRSEATHDHLCVPILLHLI